MFFNSLQFIAFFIIVVTIYFRIPHRFRWIVLLISSYYFYMSWKAEYIILIITSTLIDYIAGRKIYEAKTRFWRKFYLHLSLITNLGLLFAFKYWNFFSDSFRNLLTQFSIPLQPMTLKVLLPVGISFYTFQTLSYTVDVYRGKLKPERHLGIFAVYVSFFPQLVAGPIERATNLLPQFYKKQFFNYTRVTNGLKLMLWGFFKKIVIADKLALIVDPIYNNIGNFTGTPLIIATIFFAFQIYCDFSGYSDIAIGAAQVMGIKLMDNFNRPYSSKSVSEFWKRWHISLSSWFRDYMYIPLGGNRVSVPRWYFNLFFVFLVSGLWHGANWTFLAWGALHGTYLIVSIITRKFRKRFVAITRLDNLKWFYNWLRVTFIFLLVNIGWVFFRANSISDVFYVFTHLFVGLSFDIPSMNIGLGWMGFAYCIMLIGFLEFIHLLQKHIRMRQFISDKPIWIRWPIYWFIIIAILVLGVYQKIPFIYFQF